MGRWYDREHIGSGQGAVDYRQAAKNHISDGSKEGQGAMDTMQIRKEEKFTKNRSLDSE